MGKRKNLRIYLGFLASMLTIGGISVKITNYLDNKNRIEIIEEEVGDSCISFMKDIYVNRYNQQYGTNITRNQVEFYRDDNNPNDFDGEYYQKHYRKDSQGIEYVRLEDIPKEEAICDATTIRAKVSDTETRIEKTAYYDKPFFYFFGFLNAYDENETVDNNHEYVVTELANLINLAIKADKDNDMSTREKAKSKFIEEINKYYKKIETEDLKSIIEWNKKTAITQKDVDDSLDSNWREELKIIPPEYPSNDNKEIRDTMQDKTWNEYLERTTGNVTLDDDTCKN